MSSVYSYFMDELEKIAERTDDKEMPLPAQAALAGSALYTSYRISKGLAKNKAARVGTLVGGGVLVPTILHNKLFGHKKKADS